MSWIERCTLKISFIWPLLFAVGVAVGVLYFRALLPHMAGAIKIALNVGEKLGNSSGMSGIVFLIIFVKNTSVALLCIGLGRVSRGFVPAVICITNGLTLGVLAGLLQSSIGFSYWKFMAMLAPHGVLELTAIFAACTAGMAVVPIKERICNGLAGVVALFFIAAVIETWGTPIVGGWVV